MNLSLLRDHIERYKVKLKSDPEKYTKDLYERTERAVFYQSWTADRLSKMTEEDLHGYLTKLWAMMIWGNKKYAIDKILSDNGLDIVKKHLIDLVWGTKPVAERWDTFRKSVKGFGSAMMSEILCHSHPSDNLLWNRRVYVGLAYLGVKNLPRYDYQMTGKKYEELSGVGKAIAKEMVAQEIADVTLLTVDYFIWDELHEDKLSEIFVKGKEEKKAEASIKAVDKETSDFIHNEVRDKLAEIGTWLGFTSQTERKVADGSKVDTIWEATIGNMGRVIYVFEVQTKGSIDSLLLNLLKALNNPAVQGVVAVSDPDQLATIKKQAALVGDLNKKLKYWDYQQVLQIHEALQMVNESINSLGLVPQGF
ncbi:MAG: hypothetical protein A4E62_00056 [Syntrophorhabdus sp. PtaU1.Bin002]|nr:MAG: hypothetical protein A4E62_00056 [Syntrophorhabdus sp. PtaU1.Bin002]